MPYPVIDLRAARKLRDQLWQAKQEGASSEDLLGGSVADVALYRKDRGNSDYLMERVEGTASEAYAKFVAAHGGGLAAASDRWQLEADMAGPVHECLHRHDVEVLADPDFWRYLHLGPFRWYLLEREPEMQPHDYGGTDFGRIYWLMIRTYLWGAFAYDPDDPKDPYRRCTAVGEAGMRRSGTPGKVIDFWHSHLIRRRSASQGMVSRAFIDSATTEPLARDGKKGEPQDAREFAKFMRRFSASTSLELLSQEEIQALVQEQKIRALESGWA